MSKSIVNDAIPIKTPMNEEILRRTSIPATFYSFRRTRVTIHPDVALLKIGNVATKEEAEKYVGNAVVAFKYFPKKEGMFPVYGRITRAHGKRGALRAKFSRNISPESIGKNVFIKLYKISEEEIII